MGINALPNLDRTSPTFKSDCDTFFGSALQTFSVQAEAARVEMNSNAATASAAATTATAQATAAAASAANAVAAAGVVLWVSGTNYSTGTCVYSPINFATYRRTSSSPGSSTTDPSADSTRWQLPVVADLANNIVSGTSQTATAGNRYLLTNVAATTVTLPASPAANDRVSVKVGNGLITNVINPNGATIEGTSGNMTIDRPYATVDLEYLNSSWRIIK